MFEFSNTAVVQKDSKQIIPQQL